ncbi:hypothetical protein [Ligilactobacillus faecis]|uniref:hypothetical protein n=1 Tax=Ligilactobacillus faecis TaxID=762833 RepID=UPI00246930F5|nr:hypothetical protein [Ligilactobacillus faecis]WGN90361.1 hypothetical protein QFX10_04685 [Ligilactobacillus faecis]
MFYFKKFWIIPELFLLMLWTICKYVGPYFIKFIINALWSASASGKLSLNPTNLIAKMQSLNVSLAVLESKVLHIIILIAVLVLLWLVIDLFSGQLVRDIKLVPIIKFLVRDVNQDSLNVVMAEENKANEWIRRSRIIKWKKKLVFIMPIVANGTVMKIIKQRCEQDLLGCLSESFKTVNWTPIALKKGGLVKWVIVKQK